ncbi:MAG TPA: ParB N-terminal domain-containing protein, partial [Phycisphaerae bacterium]|nr:ParB N-terminal domain-containing protein [Phycisphaerae bacterium]
MNATQTETTETKNDANPKGTGPKAAAELVAVPVAAIDAQGQPRTHFDEGRLTELAASIGELGQLQPIVVAEGDDKNGR